MSSIFKKAAFAALIAIGSIATIPATASANEVYFQFGVGGPRHHRDYRDYGDYRDRFHHRPRGECRNALAVDKARWMGIHRPHVTYRNRHTVGVVGWRHHHRVHITFANNHRCTVVRY